MTLIPNISVVFFCVLKKDVKILDVLTNFGKIMKSYNEGARLYVVI